MLGEQPEGELLQRLFREADSNVAQALTAFFVSQPPLPPPIAAAAAAAAAAAPPTSPTSPRPPPLPRSAARSSAALRSRPWEGEGGEGGGDGEGGGEGEEEKGSGTFKLTLPQAEPPSPQPPPLPARFSGLNQLLNRAATERLSNLRLAASEAEAEGGEGSGTLPLLLLSPLLSPLPFISEIIPERAKRLVLEMTSSEEVRGNRALEEV